MTKARTQGEITRRKRGRPRKDGPRQPNGQPSRISQERQEEAQRTVALGRCRIMGWEPTAENVKRALADHMGCTAGRAIDHEPAEARAELWAAIKRIGQTFARYWQAIGAPPPYAKAAMLAYLPEPTGSDGVEASRWDDRSEQERVRAAADAMMHMEGRLRVAGAAAEVKAVVLHDADVQDYERFVRGLKAALA